MRTTGAYGAQGTRWKGRDEGGSPGRDTGRREADTWLSRWPPGTYSVSNAGTSTRCDRQEVEVPLSENEQRLLEQMERALYAEDPKFASAMRGANRRPGAGRRLLLGGVSIVLGLVVLVFGVSQEQVLLGVLGFILMLGGTAYAVCGASCRSTSTASPVSTPKYCRQRSFA